MKSPDRLRLEREISDVTPLTKHLGRAIGVAFASGVFGGFSLSLLLFSDFSLWYVIILLLSVGGIWWAIRDGVNLFGWTLAKVKTAMILLDGDVDKALKEERAATQRERFGN